MTDNPDLGWEFAILIWTRNRAPYEANSWNIPEFMGSGYELGSIHLAEDISIFGL